MRKAAPLGQPHLSRFQLVDEIARRGRITTSDASRAVASFEEIVTEYLAKGGSIRLLGFGTFTTSKRKARLGHDPREPAKRIKIPAVRIAKFLPGATLKQAVREGEVPVHKPAGSPGGQRW
jgi:nucleoid DNA-binding protein